MAGFFLSVSTVNAAINVTSTAPKFDLVVSAFLLENSSYSKRVNYELKNVVNIDSIDHYKVRLYCEAGVKALINNLPGEACNKAIKLPKESYGKFFAVFNSGPRFKASAKLKAYDKMGEWLYSSKMGVTW